MLKEILIISNYYPPESGAAPNRIHTLANMLSKNNYKVNVVCPLPNYPFGKIFNGFSDKFQSKAIEANITVYRLWLFASNSKNKFIRLFSMLSFAVHLFIFLLFKKTPKKVIIQCSPLFVGFFGVLISKLKRKTIILNVSDLWPLAGLEMGILKKGQYYRILEKIEHFNYKNATLLLGQSEEILTHFSTIVPHKKVFLYRNFPNFKVHLTEKPSNNKKLSIVYAGLLGVAQGILAICKQLNLPDNVEFHIYGNGPEASAISKLIKHKSNMFYHGSVDRNELHEKLQQYDITLVPLINRIYGSVPSKIFEYARLGLPILYFSEGEGNNLVNTYKLGITVNSLDYKKLNQVIEDVSVEKICLPQKETIRKIAEKNFNLERQFEQFLELIDEL